MIFILKSNPIILSFNRVDRLTRFDKRFWVRDLFLQFHPHLLIYKTMENYILFV